VVNIADDDAELNGKPVRVVNIDQECHGQLVRDDVVGFERTDKQIDEPTDNVELADEVEVVTVDVKPLAPIIEELESPQRHSHVAESSRVVCVTETVFGEDNCGNTLSVNSICERKKMPLSLEAEKKCVDSPREEVVVEEEHKMCSASSLVSELTADTMHELVVKMTVAGVNEVHCEASGRGVLTDDITRPNGDPWFDSK